ncbi:hypothetical protein PoB_002268100 [Plakobranchus ocellatus]|uniref:Uncharacterized protein n=1 Tax=Plakobranchus ocellatus TaxID=259542 RepID=A0AAV3ZNS1_9GAST|nr:hypothetical protein PoB_002268100 [Plakobranchus ocellatus]
MTLMPMFGVSSKYTRSGSSSGVSISYQVRGPGFESQSRPSQFFNAPLCPPSTKWAPSYSIEHIACAQFGRSSTPKCTFIFY